MTIEEYDNGLSNLVIGAAIEVHKALGPGLLESTYECCLAHELGLREIGHRLQVPLPVEYKGTRLECGYRADLIVQDRIIVELKTVEAVLPVHEAQLLTYMRLSGLRIGLLLNFHVALLRDGITRKVL